jgi:aconitate hydratase
MKLNADPLRARASLATQKGTVHYHRLGKLEEKGYGDLSRLPMTVKILLESVLRQLDGIRVTEDHLRALIGWQETTEGEFPFMPSRVLMQDFTGVPAVVDLAAMRDALADLGGDPNAINPCAGRKPHPSDRDAVCDRVVKTAGWRSGRCRVTAEMSPLARVSSETNLC